MTTFLQRLTIGQRLGVAFTAMVALMLVIAFAGRAGFAQVEREIHAINQEHSVKVFRAAALGEVANQQARSTRNLLLIDDAATRASERRRVGDTRTEATRLYDELAALSTSDEDRRALAVVTGQRAEYAKALDAYLALFDAGRTDEARRLLIGEVRDRQLAYMDAIRTYSKAQQDAMAAAGRAADTAVDRAVALMFGAAAAGIGLALAAGWTVARSITRPIGEAVEVARRVAAGDLSSRIVVGRQDETGVLLQALKTMNDNLVTLVADVRASSDSIATGSGQIASGTVDLSQRTEEQASNLQQTAASMEQLNATVRSSAETAVEATRLAGEASQAATRGGEVVGEVVGTMQQISEASRRIADIIGVIDGIAFQTNILALNAAVEAARAGEQGRGFAVVAGEVRSLAQRSAQAAREIKTLISASAEKVDAGARLADDAGQAMTGIVAQVRRVSDLIGDIGHAAREQAQGIGQVNDAVSQLDQVTQQNAALVEQSTAAAESLREQAARLVGAVSRFRVGSAATPA